MVESVRLSGLDLDVYTTLCNVGKVWGSNYVALSLMMRRLGGKCSNVDVAIRVLESFKRLAGTPGLNLRVCITRGGRVVLAQRYE